jgi:hypothetical protein
MDGTGLEQSERESDLIDRCYPNRHRDRVARGTGPILYSYFVPGVG